MQPKRLRTKAAVGVCATALAVPACAMAVLASPAHALTYGGSPWLICFNNTQGAEVAARDMPPEPANGATVPAGTPVTFSGEENHALTFDVASSPAQLSSPDIDSGLGTQSGAFYKFTSTKASATPRTIYWTASFTFIPGECEAPAIFTTPVHTLIVAPTEAELTAAKKGQEEEASRKKSEEEAATKKRMEEAAATGSVLLDGLTIGVEHGRDAEVELTCLDVEPCTGKLTLTAEAMAGKGKGRHAKSESIGTASFSTGASEEATIEVALDNAGRALMSSSHGRMAATLTILRTSPLPSDTQTRHVHLAMQGTGKTKTGK
jgi:hypothetical protein